MQFHIRLIDNSDSDQKRPKGQEAHWQYLDDRAEQLIGRGPTYTENMEKFSSTLFFIELPGWSEIHEFIDNEPHNNNNVYASIEIKRWQNEVPKTQRDFPRTEGQVNWYIRGYGNPGMHHEWLKLKGEHSRYFAELDNHVVIRGPILSDDGDEWQGSASLISMQNRDEVMEIIDKDPIYKNGLYADLLIEQFKFGGRPQQVT